MSALHLSGVIPPIPTPFGADGALALDELTRNFHHWNSFPLAGYVVLGSNGEGVHLNDVETIAVVEAARRHIPTEWKMLVGTARQSTRETVAWTRRAAELGADAALVLPPSYYRGLMNRVALVEHFVRVADAATIPVVIYNMPACTGLDLDAGSVCEMAAHENIIGIKDSGGDVAKLGEIGQHAGPLFSVLAGSAGFLLPALSVGASGGILGLANIAPQQCCDVFQTAQDGHWERAQQAQGRLIRANRAVTKQWGVPALKAAMDMLGLYGGPPRRPLRTVTEDCLAELRGILVSAGILPDAEGVHGGGVAAAQASLRES